MGRPLPTGPYRELIPIPRRGDERALRAMQAQVDPGERILWAGRPAQGVRLEASDAFFVPFGLLWGVFALLWEAVLILHDGPIWFHAVGIVSASFALHLVIGRLVAGAIRRARTVYALTDRRAILVEGRGRVLSIDLRAPLPIELREGRWGRGTIQFTWPGLRGLTPPGFVGIRDARAVYELLQDVRRARPTRLLTPPPSPARR